MMEKTGRCGKDQLPTTQRCCFLLLSTGCPLCEWPENLAWKECSGTMNWKSLWHHTQMPRCKVKLSSTFLCNKQTFPVHSPGTGIQLTLSAWFSDKRDILAFFYFLISMNDQLETSTVALRDVILVKKGKYHHLQGTHRSNFGWVPHYLANIFFKTLLSWVGIPKYN